MCASMCSASHSPGEGGPKPPPARDAVDLGVSAAQLGDVERAVSRDRILVDHVPASYRLHVVAEPVKRQRP